MSGIRRTQSEKSDKANGRRRILNSGDNLRFGLVADSIVESLHIGVVAFDPGLRIIDANPEAAKLIDLGDYIDQSLTKGTSGGAASAPDWTKELKSALSAGRTCKFDGVGYTMNDATRWLQITCIPLKKGKRQRLLGGSMLIADVTETINTKRQLANAERLATLGKLASKVAHELNDPLDGILRYINLAIRSIEREGFEKPKEYLSRCREGLMRMIQIISELLEFSRSAHTSLEYVTVEQLVEDAIRTMDAKAEASKVRILRNYAANMPRIRGGNLLQVFCNIIKNAFDAMPEGGELRISARVAAGNTAVVKFRDTGIGFPAENIETMFEPFFTTKDKGTGLGLAICRDILERYGGRITAENAPEGGSIFTVYLPLEGNS
jgi:signal transduction histidine kinase